MKVWFLQISNDCWHGWTTVHTTEQSANLFLRELQIKELEAKAGTQRAALKAMSDDELHELWEQETDRLGYYEETDLHSIIDATAAEAVVEL